MRSSRLLAVAGLVVLSACVDDPTAPPAPDDPAAALAGAKVPAPGITVMSQNMYLGANIDLLLTAQTPAELAVVFEQLGTSTLAGDFGRARQMALQIAMAAPHLVGLQEVTTYVFQTPAGSQTLDFVAVLQAYLGYFHGVFNTPLYEVYRSNWTTVYFPASQFNPSFPDVTYTDGDAILARSDVVVLGSTSKPFDAYQMLSVAGQEFDYRRGFASVLAEIDGQPVRFVNTHLEVQLFEAVQVQQTAELIAAFEDETAPVIMVGDFNSAANHDAPEHQKTASYRLLRHAGFADIWLREAHSVGGYTCCQAPDLTNPESELMQRLDLVLVRWGSAGFGGRSEMEVVGEEQADRIGIGPLTLWPSDHAGVAATLWPAPGRLAMNR